MTPVKFAALCRAHRRRRPLQVVWVTVGDDFLREPDEGGDPNGQKALAARLPGKFKAPAHG